MIIKKLIPDYPKDYHHAFNPDRWGAHLSWSLKCLVRCKGQHTGGRQANLIFASIKPLEYLVARVCRYALKQYASPGNHRAPHHLELCRCFKLVIWEHCAFLECPIRSLALGIRPFRIWSRQSLKNANIRKMLAFCWMPFFSIYNLTMRKRDGTQGCAKHTNDEKLTNTRLQYWSKHTSQWEFKIRI